MSELVLSSAAKRLRDHPAKQRIIEKYHEGETPQAIAEWLQMDLMEFPEADVGDLAQAVVELFATEVPLEDRLELASVDRSSLRRTLAKQKSRKSTYQLLRELYLVQQGRLEMYHEDELTPGKDGTIKMKGSMSHELEVARRMLMNMHEIEQDLGVRPDEAAPGPQGGVSNEMKLKLGKALKSLIDEANDEEQTIDVEVVHEDPEG